MIFFCLVKFLTFPILQKINVSSLGVHLQNTTYIHIFCRYFVYAVCETKTNAGFVRFIEINTGIMLYEVAKIS